MSDQFFGRDKTEVRRVALAAEIVNRGISSRSEAREVAKSLGLYRSEGTFSRDLAEARKSFGDSRLEFTGRGNYGGGRGQTIEVGGVKYKLKRVNEEDMQEGKMYVKRRGKTYETIGYFSSGADKKEKLGKYERFHKWLEEQEEQYNNQSSYMEEDIYEMY